MMSMIVSLNPILDQCDNLLQIIRFTQYVLLYDIIKSKMVENEMLRSTNENSLVSNSVNETKCNNKFVKCQNLTNYYLCA